MLQKLDSERVSVNDLKVNNKQLKPASEFDICLYCGYSKNTGKVLNDENHYYQNNQRKI